MEVLNVIEPICPSNSPKRKWRIGLRVLSCAKSFRALNVGELRGKTGSSYSLPGPPDPVKALNDHQSAPHADRGKELTVERHLPKYDQ